MMKKWIAVVLCLLPVAVRAEQTYTNEDLRKFSVPGAYTNQDLRKLPRVPVVKAAPTRPAPAPSEAPDAEPFQRHLDFLAEQRLIIQSELDWREEMVRKANSAFDKGPDGYPWPGFLSKNKSSIQYLKMQLAIMDARIGQAYDDARKAGVILESR
jgi:hypothetical protein